MPAPAPAPAALPAGAPTCRPAWVLSQLPPPAAPSLPCAGEFTAASLAWLESRGKADIKQLLRRLVPKNVAAVSVAKRMRTARRA